MATVGCAHIHAATVSDRVSGGISRGRALFMVDEDGGIGLALAPGPFVDPDGSGRGRVGERHRLDATKQPRRLRNCGTGIVSRCA